LPLTILSWKKKITKKGWQSGSSSRVPALQEWGLSLNSSAAKKKSQSFPIFYPALVALDNCKASETHLGGLLLGHFYLTLSQLRMATASLLKEPLACLLFPHHYSGKCLTPGSQCQQRWQLQPLPLFPRPSLEQLDVKTDSQLRAAQTVPILSYLKCISVL
jgi:hypothetical protein